MKSLGKYTVRLDKAELKRAKKIGVNVPILFRWALKKAILQRELQLREELRVAKARAKGKKITRPEPQPRTEGQSPA